MSSSDISTSCPAVFFWRQKDMYTVSSDPAVNCRGKRWSDVTFGYLTNLSVHDRHEKFQHHRCASTCTSVRTFSARNTTFLVYTFPDLKQQIDKAKALNINFLEESPSCPNNDSGGQQQATWGNPGNGECGIWNRGRGKQSYFPLPQKYELASHICLRHCQVRSPTSPRPSWWLHTQHIFKNQSRLLFFLFEGPAHLWDINWILLDFCIA